MLESLSGRGRPEAKPSLTSKGRHQLRTGSGPPPPWTSLDSLHTAHPCTRPASQCCPSAVPEATIMTSLDAFPKGKGVCQTTEAVVPRPAAAATAENLLEIQTVGSTPGLLHQTLRGWGSAICALNAAGGSETTPGREPLFSMNGNKLYNNSEQPTAAWNSTEQRRTAWNNVG